jgi:hypothetical protein
MELRSGLVPLAGHKVNLLRSQDGLKTRNLYFAKHYRKWINHAND